MTLPSTIHFARVLLALASIAWLRALGGLWYAHYFVSDIIVDPKDIMSRQTAASLISLEVGWWLALAALVLSGLLLALSQSRPRPALWAALLSGVYVIPVIVFISYVQLIH